MAYSKTTWVNDQAPDIDADNLNKMEQGIYDAQYPDGGTEGQLLARTANGQGWVDPPNSAVWGGITGDIANQNDLQTELALKISNPSGGTTGQVLTKTATGADWETIDATDIETSSGVAIKSVNGNPVTISDALQGKALGVNATLEPIQSGSGDPSPTNIRPITGRTQVDVNRTGKNLCPPVTIGQSYNNSTGVEMSDSTSASSVKFPIDKDKTYIFTKNCNVNFMIFAWDAQDNFVGRTGGSNVSSRVFDKSSFTGGSGTGDFDSIAQIAVRFYQSTDQDINDVVGAEYQVEVGDTATAYEPYGGQSVTVNLGQTVYGGTLNVTTGVLTVDRAMVDLGTLGWEYLESAHMFHTTLPTQSTIVPKKYMCNIYFTTDLWPTQPGYDAVDYVILTGGADARVRIKDSRYTTTADFKTAMSGVQLVYELATPQTIQLSPAQLNLLTGANIISTNADDLSVRYYATGQTGNVEGNIAFLLDKTASNETAVNTVSESIAPAETGTATQNYATGSYLMLNNRLCKVTSAIATGEQIIVGSNVQYTTVAEELTAILAQVNA